MICVTFSTLARSCLPVTGAWISIMSQSLSQTEFSGIEEIALKI
ncbi:MAG: hypothetical protein RLZZ135_2028 [Cyanobacteriota bacterium]|jgi:hypothetical protein